MPYHLASSPSWSSLSSPSSSSSSNNPPGFPGHDVRKSLPWRSLAGRHANGIRSMARLVATVRPNTRYRETWRVNQNGIRKIHEHHVVGRSPSPRVAVRLQTGRNRSPKAPKDLPGSLRRGPGAAGCCSNAVVLVPLERWCIGSGIPKLAEEALGVQSMWRPYF